MAEGFLGRWSQRKLDVKAGKPVEAEPPVPPPPVPAAAPVVAAAPPEATEERPPLSLDDVKALTPESDFGAFAARGVDPQVRNAAMKKLFSDPRYNVMDGLDVYIDDYTRPDPLPEAMVRQLASAKFLKLFEREEENAPPGDDLNNPARADVAQSGLCNELPSQPAGAMPAASRADDDHPDLRLQPDDAPPGEGPGDSAG